MFPKTNANFPEEIMLCMLVLIQIQSVSSIERDITFVLIHGYIKVVTLRVRFFIYYVQLLFGKVFLDKGSKS